MKKKYMGQIMAECDCQHTGCEMRGYCMAAKITELEKRVAELEEYEWMYKDLSK